MTCNISDVLILVVHEVRNLGRLWLDNGDKDAADSDSSKKWHEMMVKSIKLV